MTEFVAEGKLVGIRPVTPQDNRFLYDIWHDSDVQRNLNFQDDRPISIWLDEHDKWVSWLDCTIMSLTDGQPVGYVSLGYRMEDPQLVIFLLPAYRGRGIGTEAARLILDHGFNALGMSRISAGVFHFNTQCQRMLEKLGFRYDPNGDEAEDNDWGEGLVNQLTYNLERDEFYRVVGDSVLRNKLYSLLGDLPPRDRPISAELVSEEDRGAYDLETLTLDLNGIEPVPAYFAKPKDGGKRPTVLYHHAHGGKYAIGKTELISPRGELPSYADALTAMGYNVLCIDMWNFGGRSGRTESSLFKEMLWKGQVLWGMMVYDSIRSVDYLASRPDVDAVRIGTVGMSLGSTMAWWLAALDERVKVCVDICCLTDFDALIEENGLDGHGIYYYVPSLLKEWTTGKINALIAPRPHLALAGDLDKLAPAKGLDRVDAELKTAYAEAGAPEAWKLSRYPVGHMETGGMRQEALEWFGRWL